MTMIELAGLTTSAVPGFDADSAVSAYLATLDGAARERSDSYFEGGYWLILINAAVGLVVAFILLQSGFARTVRDKAEAWMPWRWLAIPLFVIAWSLATSVLTFPLTLYEGFIREHAYNLSTMTLPAWLGEWAMQLLVSTIMGAVFLTVFYVMIRAAKAAWWLWGAGIAIVFMAFALLIAPVYIEPLFNDYTPMEEGELRDDILAVAHANGIPADDVYVFDVSRQSNRITANVSGLFGTTRIALSDTLVEQADADEVLAVMGHEIGHYVLNHIWEMFIYFGVLLALGLAFADGLFKWANKRFGQRWGVKDIGDIAGLPLLSACLTIFFLVTTPVYNRIVYTNEAEADIFGLNAAREPDGFATVALRLSSYRKISPSGWEEFMFFDHPSGQSRVAMAMDWKAGQLEMGADDQSSDLRIDRAEQISAELEAANSD
ncbi:M48 family metallopeptidase [Maricaulis alexandrii]|uniref:M48 family metallopeptidase n=1 Tax=Maricaulis alexandrii TaxID=2570354 RepID=UPI001F1A290F|nr:M48 family metallopeptidase [Maricaulis alexandrii]